MPIRASLRPFRLCVAAIAAAAFLASCAPAAQQPKDDRIPQAMLDLNHKSCMVADGGGVFTPLQKAAFCDCLVEEIDRTMTQTELLGASLDIVASGGMTPDGGMNKDKAVAAALRNEKLRDASINCVVKSLTSRSS